MAKLKDPIDDEADMAEGTKRAVAEFEKNLAADPDGAAEVPIEDDPDPDEALDRTPSRAERRAERGLNYKTLRERSAAAEARAQALEEQLTAIRSAPAPHAAPAAAPPPAPTEGLEKELDKTYRAQAALLDEYNDKVSRYVAAKQTMPRDEWNGYDARSKELDQKRIDLLLDIREAKTAPQRRADEQRRSYVARAPDVFNNPRAADYAHGYFVSKVAENPQIDQEQLFEETVEATRRTILGKRPPPDAATRQRATGMARGSIASSSAQPSTLQMTPELRRMARAAYPKLEPDKAYQRWANENGRKLMALERESGRGRA